MHEEVLSFSAFQRGSQTIEYRANTFWRGGDVVNDFLRAHHFNNQYRRLTETLTLPSNHESNKRCFL